MHNIIPLSRSTMELLMSSRKSSQKTNLMFLVLLFVVPVYCTDIQNLAPWPNLYHDSLKSNRANPNTPIISASTCDYKSEPVNALIDDGLLILNNETVAVLSISQITLLSAENLTEISKIDLPFNSICNTFFSFVGTSNDGRVMILESYCYVGQGASITLVGYSWDSQDTLWSRIIQSTQHLPPYVLLNSLDNSVTLIIPNGVKNTTLMNLDSETGFFRWENSLTSNTLYPLVTSPPNNLILYSVNTIIDIISINSTTGNVVWTTFVEHPVNMAVSTSNSVVIFGSHDSTVYSLDSSNGTLRWFLPNTIEISSDTLVAVGTNDQILFYNDLTQGNITIISQEGDVRYALVPLLVIDDFVTVGDSVIVVGSDHDLSDTIFYKFMLNDSNPTFQNIGTVNSGNSTY
eukprot:TRINITY_DN15111_c0_g1_i1.p1 TRINITY_DN15111_c0_g1~~TRINITY_DN15111_c0_g1_i1.p1  ORF type:complete len:404 (-),score=3.39 TRINITY_DN15111_c0_g1_i1:244-1455(-)